MNENREKLHRLLDAVLDTNGLEARTQEKTGLKPTVFFEFLGHVAECVIRVHDGGWFPDSNWNKSFNFDVYDNIPDEKVEEACAYMEAVCLPNREEEILRHMIENKEKSIGKATAELEELRKRLAKEVGAND